MKYLFRLRSYLKPYRWQLLLNLALLLAGTILSLIVPQIIQQVIDQGLKAGAAPFLIRSALILVGIGFKLSLAPFQNSGSKLIVIVESRVPGLSVALTERLVRFAQSLRKADLKKAPAISEVVDWALALVAVGADGLLHFLEGLHRLVALACHSISICNSPQDKLSVLFVLFAVPNRAVRIHYRSQCFFISRYCLIELGHFLERFGQRIHHGQTVGNILTF